MSIYTEITAIIYIILATGFIISGIDDLLIDILYWGNSLIRTIRYPRWNYPWLNESTLHEEPQKKAAVLLSTWHEDDVIAQCLLTNYQLIDYQNYDFYVGTYPNDQPTQDEVDRVSKILPNVYKSVTKNPGPTSKGDCLNNTYLELKRQEQISGEEYSFILMHDPEDVMHPLELKLCNYLMGRGEINMVQTPVFPLEVPIAKFTAGTYMDEFAETHTKDMYVREWIDAFVPSAGVGTAISHNAFERMDMVRHEDLFATNSLTEDYDLGVRLKEIDIHCVFVRQAIVRQEQNEIITSAVNNIEAKLKRELPAQLKTFFAKLQQFSEACGVGIRTELIATRAYFPDTPITAIRQRTRWTLGTVFQSWKNLGWPKGWKIRWLLVHDRKSFIAYFWVVAGYIFFLYVGVYSLIRSLFFHHLPPALPNQTWVVIVAWVTVFLMGNRLLQRMISVTRIYGIGQGVLSLLRQPWGSIINACAAFRALTQFIKSQRSQKIIAWDKTKHYFPTPSEMGPYRKRLGELLIETHQISTEQLNEALKEQKEHDERLGETLIRLNYISELQLEDALQFQQKEKVEA